MARLSLRKRYYIDVDHDQFLPDTPIRVRIDDESAPISAARDQAREKGERIALDFRGCSTIAGRSPVSIRRRSSLRIHFGCRSIRARVPAVDQPLEFRLTEITFHAAQTVPASMV